MEQSEACENQVDSLRLRSDTVFVADLDAGDVGNLDKLVLITLSVQTQAETTYSVDHELSLSPKHLTHDVVPVD